MKLELKHLAFYHPFAVDYIENKRRYTLINLNYFHESRFSFSGKLILHPLSDLTKEIIVNEIKSTYLVQLWNRTRLKDMCDYYELVEEFKENIIDFAPYSAIQMLLQWHFDIFGLIDAGLAVDINSL